MALPHDATGLSTVCDCGISCSYSLFFVFCCMVLYSIDFLADDHLFQFHQDVLKFPLLPLKKALGPAFNFK